MSTGEDTKQEKGISTRSVEAVVAVLIFALGAVVLYDSVRLGAKWGSDGPQAGYFPFYIGLLVCACSLAILVQALRGRSGGPRLFVAWGPFRQVLAVLLPATLYVLGIQLFGIYLASVVYIAGFMVWLGRYPWPRSLAIAAVTMIAFFLMFEVWFKVALYKGLFNPLAFLGY